jgi:hypothetical protein
MHDGNGFTMQGQHLIRAVYLLVGLWRSFRKYPIIVHFHRARRGRRQGDGGAAVLHTNYGMWLSGRAICGESTNAVSTTWTLCLASADRPFIRLFQGADRSNGL